MKNLAILLYDATLMGGAENIALSLAEELSAFHNVSIISLFNENNKPFWKIKKEVEFLTVCNKATKISLHLYKISRKIKSIITNKKIDVVFCITAGVVTPAVIAAKGTKTKLVYCEHSNLKNNSYGRKHQIRQWIGVNFADWIVTLTKEDMMAFKNRYNRNNISFIYNWYNHEISDTKYSLQSMKIISAGRFVKLKGYDKLVNVAYKVFEEFPEWQWDIYGDGEEFADIENRIVQYGLENNLFLKGRSNNMSNIYKDYAIYVLTSKYEGLPMVLLEAQANHLPIISFDCPTGPKEVVSDGINGFLIEPDNVEEMYMKIKSLIQNDKLRESMSSQSMINFDKFKKQNILPQWLTLIDYLLSEEK